MLLINKENKPFGLWKQIKEDFGVPKKNDPALNSSIELLFNYPGVWAIINHRFANRLYKCNFKLTARIIMGISQFFCKMDIHPAATIGRRVFIDHGIGVVIEDDVLIYQGVTLGGTSLNKGKRHPTIKTNSVIGRGAKVLGNITVGKNSKIGANSVVVRDVPENSTAVGIPAKVIKRKDSSEKLNHADLPDFNKEMFDFLIKKVALVEHSLKKQECIDLEKENNNLESIYKNFIYDMKDSNQTIKSRKAS